MLFNELTTLQITLDNKNNELLKLKNQLLNYVEANKNLMREKDLLDNQIYELRDIKTKNKLKLDQMMITNDNLSKKCLDQEELISRLEEEKRILIELNEELDNESKQLALNAKNKNSEYKNHVKQLEIANMDKNEVEKNFDELSKQNMMLKKQIDEISETSRSEIKKRIEKDKNLNNLEKSSRDKEDEIHRYKIEIKNLKEMKEKVVEDNVKLFNSLEKLRHHLVILSDQNAKLSEELNNILVQDQRIKSHLQRRDEINNVVSNNKDLINKSQENVKSYLLTSKKNLTNYLNLNNQSNVELFQKLENKSV